MTTQYHDTVRAADHCTCGNVKQRKSKLEAGESLHELFMTVLTPGESTTEAVEAVFLSKFDQIKLGNC